MTTFRSVAAACALAFVAVAPAGAQTPRPHLDWRTAETRHFRFHYPADAERWTLDLAARMESVSDAVVALVGSRPKHRVTVVVEDPENQSNGSAWPLLDRPLIYLWPTPAGARSSIGHSRSWEEELAVHEFAHIAHLTRPSRNWRQRVLWRISPLRGGPVAARTPRWAIEGYATYVEGRLTGSGRPYGAARAAALREWSLEGQLPKYGELDGAGGYRGGEMAYLAGSAFFEWLIARSGEGSLPKVWRRLSARQPRSFDQAFAGVFGATPAALYGRFSAELTGRALAVEQRLGADSSELGELVLAPRGHGYDDPAVSPDGSLLAVRLRRADRPGPVLVVRTRADTVTDRERRARARARRLDPEDVPALEYLPRPKREVARLEPAQGEGYEEPRFFRDGERMLVTRWTGLADGSVRPDLYEWTLASGRVRRITQGAAVRGADPSPDGRRAVAVRCRFGLCGLVTVDLASGRIDVIVPGAVGRVFDRPRFSPDGRTIAVAVQEGGRWRPALYTLSPGRAPSRRDVSTSDSASRYEPAFTRDGRRLLVTSERGGIANIEIIDIATGAARTLTSVTGAAAAPVDAATDSSVYYLNLRAEGLEVRRVASGVGLGGPGLARVVHDSALAPALPLRVTAVADTFARGAVSRPRAYGLGPRGWRYLPGQVGGSEGSIFTLALVNADPVSRLTAVAQGGLGSRSTWRAGSVSATYRGRRPWATAELFVLRHEPDRPSNSARNVLPDVERYAGGTLVTTLVDDFGWRVSRYRAGLSAGTLGLRGEPRASRALALAEYSGEFRVTLRGIRVGAFGATHGSSGQTGGESWRRGTATLGLRAAALGVALGASGTLGLVNAGAPAFERFVAGGIEPPFIEQATLSQRTGVPALPVGFATGRRIASYRFSSSFAGLEPYYLAIAAGDRVRGAWTRVAGVEQRVVTPPLGLLGLPPLEISAGVGYPLNGPFRYDTQFYGGVTVRP